MKKSLKEDKFYKFFNWFIPFFYTIGGLFLIKSGCEIIKELDGFLAIGVAMSILLMSFGAVGLLLKEELRNEK